MLLGRPGRTENEFTLYTHQLYSEETIKFLNVWRHGEPVTLVDVFPDKVKSKVIQNLQVHLFVCPYVSQSFSLSLVHCIGVAMDIYVSIDLLIAY